MKTKKKYIDDKSYHGYNHKTYTFTLSRQKTRVLLEFLHGWEGVFGPKSFPKYKNYYSHLGNIITTQKKAQDVLRYPEENIEKAKKTTKKEEN